MDGLRGVAAGVLTPFDAALDVDHDAIASNVAFLSERGITTLLAAANISEYHALTHEERIASVETVVDAAPDATTVLAGVGGATRTALDAAAGAEAAGADAAMVMPPDHTYVHESGLLTYYEKLGAGSDLPLVPYVRGFDPSVDFLSDLAALDSVAGVKYAVEDVPKFAAAVAADDTDTVWVDGMAEPYAPSLWLGAPRDSPPESRTSFRSWAWNCSTPSNRATGSARRSSATWPSRSRTSGDGPATGTSRAR